jgi:hypothetical protein
VQLRQHAAQPRAGSVRTPTVRPGLRGQPVVGKLDIEPAELNLHRLAGRRARHQQEATRPLAHQSLIAGLMLERRSHIKTIPPVRYLSLVIVDG